MNSQKQKTHRGRRILLVVLVSVFLFLFHENSVYAQRGKVAIVNQNFYGVKTEDINNPKMVIDTYNATSDNPNDPVNEQVYSGETSEEAFARNAHGTMVYQSFTGEMGKHWNHDNPDILLVKTASNNSSIAQVSDEDLAKGIIASADWGADVINISLQSPNAVPKTQSAIEYAKNKGTTVVISSGNFGEKDPGMMYPAKSGGGIAVGAHDAQGHPLAYTSGLGDEHLDLTARVPLLEINPDGSLSDRDLKGTSFAAPVVAADAYLLKKSGDPSKYDTDGDGKLSQDEVRIGLNKEAGKRFPNISSISYDRKKYLKDNYNFVDNSDEKKQKQTFPELCLLRMILSEKKILLRIHI